MASVYKVTVHLAWGGIGGRNWRNTFEFNYDGGNIDSPVTNTDDITPNDFVFSPGWETPLVNFYRDLHLTPVYIDRVTVSTWLPDTRVSEASVSDYDAQEIAVFPVGLYGLRPLSAFSNALDLEQTLFVRRRVGSGRLGRLNLRGVLTQDDVETNLQGKTQLRSTSEVGPTGDRWTDAYNYIVSNYIGDGASSEGLYMVMFGVPQNLIVDGNLRYIQSLDPVGVTSVNLTKRNKAPTEDALAAKLRSAGYTVLKGS